jgi:hypothetical protein
MDTADNEGEPTLNDDGSLTNAGLPAQPTDDSVQRSILSENATGKRRAAEDSVEAGDVGVREGFDHHVGQIFDRVCVGHSKQLFKLTDLLFRRKCMVMITQIRLVCALTTTATRAQRRFITSN